MRGSAALRSKCSKLCFCGVFMSAIPKRRAWPSNFGCLGKGFPNRIPTPHAMKPDLYSTGPPIGLLKGFSPLPHQLELDVVVPHNENGLPGFGEFLLVELAP